jgi:hypothetical protein
MARLAISPTRLSPNSDVSDASEDAFEEVRVDCASIVMVGSFSWLPLCTPRAGVTRSARAVNW